jgi:4-amino-4-deoxy-L-arabinose transferase-like glycosyltransferase
MQFGNWFDRIKNSDLTASRVALYLLLAYLFYLSFAWVFSPSVENVRLTNQLNGETKTITLPYRLTTPPFRGRDLSYDMDIKYKAYQTAKFHLRANGCIHELIVNSTPVSLNSYASQRCKLDGFSIPLSPYLRAGVNTLNVKVVDTGESTAEGLHVKADGYPVPTRPFNLLIPIVLLLAALWPVAARNAYRNHSILFWVLLWSVLVRLPYFFTSFISIDESTFILMGMDILEGHLPYVHIIDNKPPLVFLIFALFQLFADDLVGIRFIGALWVGLTGYILYLAGKRIGQTNAGIWAAFLYPAFITLSYDGGCVMSEVIAMLPVTGFIYFLLSPTPTRKDALYMGLCLGLAVLIRTNLSMLAPAFLLLLKNPFATQLNVKNITAWFRHAFPLGVYGFAGVVSPLVLVCIIYAIPGHLTLLIKSIYHIPVAFSYGNIFGYTPVKDAPFSQAVSFLVGMFYKTAKELYLGTNRIVYDAGAIACIWGLFFCKGNLRAVVFKLFIVQLLCIISIIASKNAFHHYFLQLTPVFAMLVALLAAHLFQNFKTVLVGLYILSIALMPISKAGNEVYERWRQYEPVQKDGWHLASEYIKRNGGAEGEYIFSCSDAILYFLTKSKIPPVWYGHMDVLPLSGVVQLGKLMGATRYEYKDILEDVFAKKPKYFFAPDWHVCLKDAAEVLAKDYILVKEFEYLNLYQRKQ